MTREQDLKSLKKYGWKGISPSEDMTNYHDHDAMYVYNLLDADNFKNRCQHSLFNQGNILRSGQIIHTSEKSITRTIFIIIINFHYLGGIKWKL